MKLILLLLLFLVIYYYLINNISECFTNANVLKIYYINLEHRTDRNKEILDTLSIFPKENITRIDAFKTPENGAIGCLKSHIKALSLALEQKNIGNEYVMICEDDLEFMENPIPYINQFMEQKINWDVLMVAHNTYRKESTKHKNIIKIIESQTTACYIIKLDYIPILLNIYKEALSKFESTGVWDNIYCTDQIWKSLQTKHNWFTFAKRIAKQRAGFSDIVGDNVNYMV